MSRENIFTKYITPRRSYPMSYPSNRPSYRRQSQYKSRKVYSRKSNRSRYAPRKNLYVKKPQTKFLDVPFNDATVDINGASLVIGFQIQEGTAIESDRVGNEIICKNLMYRLAMKLNAQGVANSVLAKVRVVCGIGHNGAANFDATELYEINLETTPNFTTGFRQVAFTNKYTILKDEIQNCPYGGFNSTSSNNAFMPQLIEGFIDLKALTLQYSGNTGAAADLEQDYLFITVFPTEDEDLAVVGETRLRYV